MDGHSSRARCIVINSGNSSGVLMSPGIGCQMGNARRQIILSRCHRTRNSLAFIRSCFSPLLFLDGSSLKKRGRDGLISSHTFALLPLLIASRKPLLSVARKISRFDISLVYACGHVLKESQIIQQIHNNCLFNCT